MKEEEKKEVELEEEDEDLDIDDIDSDEDEEEEKSEDRDDGEKKPKEEQDKSERARQAQRRREREAKEREEREKEIERRAYLKGQLDGIKTNPYTNEPIEDEYDLEVYKIQVELEKEGKDPIADLPKRQAELARRKAKEAMDEEKAKKERDERIDNEFTEFRSKYPDVNVQELLRDPDFADYADGRLGVGKKTLTQIYESFIKFKEKVSGGKKEEEEDNKPSSPSPNGGRKTTKTSYSEMSEEEKIKELRRQGLIK